jgi:NAD(P)-dependent dehydrogenase (short-subunit alcohol dehydrogenase family)
MQAELQTTRKRPIALITGGARGMGFSCAKALAPDCAGVALVDIDSEALDRASSNLQSVGNHISVATDVRNAVDVTAMVETVTRSLGPPTILINAAGILRPTRFLDIAESEWDAVVDVSLKGSFLCSKACLPAMVDQRWGRIVNFSSTAGKNVSTLGGAHYTAAKAGLLGLTRALAVEVAAYGICVNAVCPGLIDTEMSSAYCPPEQLAEYVAATPISRLGSPDEVAELVAFLCSDRAAYITGAALDINGGQLMV